MRVAIVGNSAETMLNFRMSLLSTLRDQGHEVHALCPDFTDRSRGIFRAVGILTHDYKLSRSGTNPFRELHSIVSLYFCFRGIRPDAALCYFLKPSIYGTIGAYFAGVGRRIGLIEGLGYSFRDHAASSMQRLVQRASTLLLRVGLSLADRVLVLNDEDRRDLVEKCSLAQASVETVGGIGVNLNDFARAPVKEIATTFVMAARLIAEKGVDEYLRAAEKLKNRYPNSRFILLGGVDQNPHSLRAEEVKPWAEAGIIDWPGHVDDVRPWLHQADVFVLPSYYREGVPRSIQEAMACSLPIITTDNVGCRDTVELGENGFLVQPRDVDALAVAMENFLTTPGLARRMGRRSRIIAEVRFDSANFDRKIIEHLTQPARQITGS